MAEITYQMILSTLQTAGLLIGISYYIMTLRNQQKNQQLSLETRQAQLFMGIYNNTFASAPYRKATNVIFKTTWNNYEEFKELIFDRENMATEFADAYGLVGFVLEGVGVLVREELLDIRFVALLLSSQVKMFWEKNIPIIDKWRQYWNTPRVWSETEYIYNALMKYMEEHPELNT